MEKSATKSLKDSLPVVLVIFSLLIGAIEPIIVKMGHKINITNYDMLVLRFMASALVILPFTRSFRILNRDELKRMLPVCILFTLINIFFYISLVYLSAIAVITFITTTPAFVALVNQRRGKDVLGKTFWPGFILCFIGVLLTVEVFTKGIHVLSPLGLLTISLVILGSTLYRTEMDGVTKEFGAVLTSNYIFITNGILAILGLPFVSMKGGAETFTYGLWLGVAAVASNLAFLWSIKILGSTKISVWGVLQRPIVIFLSAIVLKESIGLDQIAGILLVLVGIQLSKVQKREKKS